ncbi:T9SS type A sorting domain-containing protein [Flavobacterium enshiense]|uniref:T9SS type A sorting domain-containing protein n=1 Tax=Flavobacterium enshiense TaxID=1341165 RepID=UPI00345DEF7B
MKKIIFTFLMLGTAFFSEAQVSFEASKDYAKLQNITYDPVTQNKLYASTLGNHIVVSHDNGLSWNLLYTYPGNTFITGLKLLPGNNALSFGTQEAIYIFNLTTNTLSQSVLIPQSGVDGAGLSDLKTYSIHDAAANIMIVDTGFFVGLSYQGKTFYTVNGGNTWSEVYYTVSNDNVFINNVAISPNNPNKLFLARGHGDTAVDGGLLISNDAGQTWGQTLEGVTLDPIAFNPSNPNDVLIGSSMGYGMHPENLYRSSDNGVTWNPQPIAWSDGGMNNITKIAFNPLDSQQIIVLEENDIVTSANGGATWNATAYPIEDLTYYYGLNASFNPYNYNQIAISTDYYPKFYDMATATLEQISAPFCFVMRSSHAKYAGNGHLYYDIQGGIFHKNINSSLTSSYNVQQPNAYNVRRNSIIPDPTIAGRLFVYSTMGFFGGVLKMSTDYGENTVDLFQTFAEEVTALKVHPTNPNIIFVAFRSGGAGSLTKIDFTNIWDIQITDIQTPDLASGEELITGLAIHPTDPNTMFITKRTRFYKSSDGGSRWADFSIGLEALDPTMGGYIWGLDANPLNSNQFTICTTNGIFTTYNSGEAWSLLSSRSNVKKIKHSPLSNGVIIGSVYSTETDNASILYSQDTGISWTEIPPSAIAYVQSYEMDYDFAGSTINVYIATSDLGIVKHQINNITLGVNNPDQNIMGIKVYPNPTKDVLNISANYEISSLKIYDMLGKCALDKELNFTNGQLDISKLNEGCYTAKITFNNNTVQNVKIIKQ